MQSSLIGKIEKARRYAQEKDRITFESFSLRFHGENNDYHVSLENGQWHCTCEFFSNWKLCSHTMAMEKFFPACFPRKPAPPSTKSSTPSIKKPETPQLPVWQAGL
jgi:hypothetical protein